MRGLARGPEHLASRRRAGPVDRFRDIALGPICGSMVAGSWTVAFRAFISDLLLAAARSWMSVWLGSGETTRDDVGTHDVIWIQGRIVRRGLRPRGTTSTADNIRAGGKRSNSVEIARKGAIRVQEVRVPAVNEMLRCRKRRLRWLRGRVVHGDRFEC